MTSILVVSVLVILALAALPFFLEWRRTPMDRKARDAAPGQFARLSDGVTHYQWHGPSRGPVAVCVHGITTPSFVFDGIVKGLVEKGYSVLTYDLFGRGFSDRPKADYNREFYIRQLKELLENQGISGHVMLVGYSMGGCVAMGQAGRMPDKIARLVLIAPAGLAHSVGGTANFARNVPILGDWVMQVFGGRRVVDDAQPSETLPDLRDRMREQVQSRGFLRAVLSSYRNMVAGRCNSDLQAMQRQGLPILAIWGEDDAIIPSSAREKMAALNPDVRHVIIPGAGHAVPHSHARQVATAMDQFLREDASGRRGAS